MKNTNFLRAQYTEKNHIMYLDDKQVDQSYSKLIINIIIIIII